MKLKFRPSFGQVSDTFRSPCFGQVSAKFRPSFGKIVVSAKFRPSFRYVSDSPVSAKFRPSFGQVSENCRFGQVSAEFPIRFGKIVVSAKFQPSFGQVSAKFRHSTKLLKSFKNDIEKKSKKTMPNKFTGRFQRILLRPAGAL